MKGKWWLFVLIGLVLLLTVQLAGWLPLFTLFGLRVVDSENGIGSYLNELAPILEEWKGVIGDWEESANDPSRLSYLDLDAETAYSKMETIVASWDTITPPDKAKEYHLWMRHAMNYEKGGFEVLAEYYSLGEYSDTNEGKRLRTLAKEIWVLKDKALLKAEASIPKK